MYLICIGEKAALIDAGCGADHGSPEADLVNYSEAIKWYRLAAEQGDANAQFSLGGMYLNGEGVPRTPRKRRGGSSWPPLRDMKGPGRCSRK